MWWCVDVCVPVETLHECDGCNIGKEGGRIGDSNPMRSGAAGHAIFQTSDCSNWWTNQSTLFSEFTGSFIPGGLGSIKTLQKCSVYIANGVQPRLRLKKKKKKFSLTSVPGGHSTSVTECLGHPWVSSLPGPHALSGRTVSTIMVTADLPPTTFLPPPKESILSLWESIGLGRSRVGEREMS